MSTQGDCSAVRSATQPWTRHLQEPGPAQQVRSGAAQGQGEGESFQPAVETSAHYLHSPLHLPVPATPHYHHFCG